MANHSLEVEPFSLADYTRISKNSTKIASLTRLNSKLQLVRSNFRINRVSKHLPSLRRTLAAIVHELGFENSGAKELCDQYSLWPTKAEEAMIARWRKLSDQKICKLETVIESSLQLLVDVVWEGQAIVESVCDTSCIELIGGSSQTMHGGVILIENPNSSFSKAYSYGIHSHLGSITESTDYFVDANYSFPQIESQTPNQLSRKVLWSLKLESQPVFYMQRKINFGLPFKSTIAFAAKRLLIRTLKAGNVGQQRFT